MTGVGDLYFVIIRLCSLLIVSSLYVGLPRELYSHVYFGLLFSHYTLAFVKARHKAAEVLMNPNAHLPLLLLGAVTLAYPYSDWPTVMFYFGFHHAANDTYMRFNLNSQDQWRLGYSLRPVLFVLNLASYFIVIRHDTTVNWIPLPILILLYVGSATYFWHGVWQAKSTLSRRGVIEALSFEGINLAFIILSLVMDLHLVGLDFVFYHLLVWIFIPLWRVHPSRHQWNWPSLATNLSVAALYFMLTPSFGVIANMSNGFLERQANIWGFIHMSFTVAVSNLNPASVRSLFSGGVPWLRAWR